MALEPIDATTHSRDIEQEYQKVVRGTDNDTTWLIISPNTQKEYLPSSTGSSFSDFLQSFDETKVEYGIARVSPPGSDVGKIILVGWCPDSAPMKTRASFAANFGTIANSVLPGYHIQVTARDEDDLDEEELLTKISNAAGARYSIQAAGNSVPTSSASGSAPVKKVFTPSLAKKESEPKKSSVPPPVREEPVPVNVVKDNDADDWDEPEIKERNFETNPLSANKPAYEPIGKIDLKKVIAEETAKEDPRLINRIDPSADIAHLKQESKIHRDNDLDNLLKQEKTSSPAVGGTKPPLVKSDFSRNDNSDKVIQGFKTEKSPAQLWAEKKMKQNQQSDSAQEEQKPVETKTEIEIGVDNSDEMKIGDLKSRFEKLGAETETEPEPPVQWETDSIPTVVKPQTFGQPAANSKPATQEVKKPFTPSNIGQRLPGMHTETPEHEEEDNDDDWGEDEDETPKRNIPPPVMPARESAPQQPLPPRNTEPEPVEEGEEEEEEEAPAPSLPSRNAAPEPEPEQPQEEEEEEEEEEEAPAPSLPSRGSVPPPPPQRAVEPEEPAAEAPWATAEYDYEAGEDNELTFAENDKIINIEFVDDDWWLGELETTGQKGLFPSNYVVLGN
ncbi:actin binding protein [Maudiozyma exigua]|uniref:Actin-binding protein n=1 Tax=Maudiozyma exigua TaxID=34358 RepID=A0A9P6WEC2_MAUEX|nr:actin binding protein [Kazachstania exigua]